MQITRRRFAHVFCLQLLAFSLILAGCASYKLGKHAGTPFSTINVAPIINETQAAQVQAILHEQLANSLQQENTLRVVDAGGQATLRVRITSYKNDVAATRPDDSVRGSVYTLRMRTLCTLTDNATGKDYFRDREIIANANAPSGESFSAAEYQTIPIITRELALRIKDSVVSTW